MTSLQPRAIHSNLLANHQEKAASSDRLPYYPGGAIVFERPDSSGAQNTISCGLKPTHPSSLYSRVTAWAVASWRHSEALWSAYSTTRGHSLNGKPDPCLPVKHQTVVLLHACCPTHCSRPARKLWNGDRSGPVAWLPADVSIYSTNHMAAALLSVPSH